MSSSKVVTIQDSKTGSSARILVEQGFNCFSFEARFGSEVIETLWAAAGFETGGERPSGSGIPILFPFPGRINRGAMRWNGREYPLEPNDGRGNAIHGFVYTRPWRVLEQHSASVVGQFQASVDDPALLGYWPADFRITAEYHVRGNSLEGIYTIDNPASTPLPFGFGTHPYFRVPLGGEDAAECEIRAPVTGEWELADLVPTGEYRPVRDPSLFSEGLTFGEVQFDNVFGGLEHAEDGWCRCSIRDPSSQRTMTMAFDRPFRELVIYTPPHREAICLEPYTCAPNLFELAEKGVDAGLRVLESGESMQARVVISVE